MMNFKKYIGDLGQIIIHQHPYQVRDTTAFSIHLFIVHHIKITIHLPYCDLKLVYNNNTKIKYTLKDVLCFCE